MADHIDEEEQLENLKRWWKENWLALATGLGIGVGAIGGWEAYRRWHDGRAETASQMYEEMKKALAESRTDEAGRIVDRLTSEFAGTPYAATASLRSAQAAVEKGDLDAASASLSWVIEHADDDAMTQLARLRKARVLFAQARHDEALATLSGDADSFLGLYEELRGDILLAKGDRPAARSAYDRALKAIDETATHRNLLEQKLDDLAVAVNP
ncbi:MAG: YfgM family protein [Panacagrimonas sp.]